MAFTLLEICQSAARLAGVQVPNTIIGNNAEVARRSLAYANQRVMTIVRRKNWPQLETKHQFASVADQAAYALPAGMKAWQPGTFWDATNDEPMMGPMSAIEWEALNESTFAAGSTLHTYFRRRGNSLELYPVPTTTGVNFSFVYDSNEGVVEADGTTFKRQFTVDTDQPRVADDVLELFVTADLMRWTGEANADLLREAEIALDYAKSQVQRHSPRARSDRSSLDPLAGPNMPESGYGGV